MTTKDMTSYSPEEPESLGQMFREVFDLIDETVEGITDEEINERLWQVLADTGGHGELQDTIPAIGQVPAVSIDLILPSTSGLSDPIEPDQGAGLLKAAQEEAAIARASARAAWRETKVQSAKADRAARAAIEAQQHAAKVTASADAYVNAALDRAQAILAEAREQAERIITEAAQQAANITDAAWAETVEHGLTHEVAALASCRDGTPPRQVDGESLEAMLGRIGTLHPTEAMALVAQAAEALAAVHASGTVHRDVKPGNLLVHTDGRLVLTDFGIARTPSATQLTNADTVMGTASYLAPELILGEPATPATDLYALGVVAYQCLAGKRPFEATTPLSVALKHVQELPPPLPATIPAEARDVVMVALAKEAGARWPDATAMAEAAWSAAATGMPVGQPSTATGGASNMAAAGAPVASITTPTDSSAACTPVETDSAGSGRDADSVFATLLDLGRVRSDATDSGRVGSVPGAARRCRILALAAAAVLLLATGLFVAVRLTMPGSARANDRMAGVASSSGYPSKQPGNTASPKDAAPGRTVAPTTPPAGQPAPPPSVNASPHAVPVPNVIGDDPDTARKTLTDAGFVVDVKYNNGQGRCKVVSQHPTGNITISRGDTVTITLKHSCLPDHSEKGIGEDPHRNQPPSR